MTSYFYLNFDLLKKSGLLLLTFMTVALLVLPLTVKAQVNIGSADPPQPFSILEFSTKLKEGGLRMPQLSTKERDKLNVTSDAAQGLWIYNTDNNCLEFWNGKKWISLCNGVSIAPTGVTLSPVMSNVALGATVVLKATVDPANATSIQYEWERSYNGVNWTTITGESASTLNAQADFAGDIYYRVTASNNAGSVISNVAQITATLPEGGANPNPTVQLYAGAFWRAGEKGERLIQFGVGTGLGNSGNWTASVAWYDGQWNPDTDGVVLANSAPVALPKSGDAESSPVTGGARSISGTVGEGGTIAFRIGLDKQFANYNADTNPARYAIVMLTYNNGKKWHKMFIRQGEGADYLMRQSEPETSLPNRPFAVKFSPYNLTNTNGPTPPTPSAAIGISNLKSLTNGGIFAFADFPTKAGFHFMFSNTVAAEPDYPAAGDVSPTIGAWNQNAGLNNSSNLYWNPSWETCPSGYRRPTDGPVNGSNQPTNTSAFNTAGAVAGSEMRQSLWSNPPSGTASNTENSVWGYYADGYFDRRVIQDARGLSFVTKSAVATYSNDVAYIGRLFFNPVTNASLFFSGGGYRYWQNAALYNAGGRGRYWSSTAMSESNSGTRNAWFLYLYNATDGVSASMQTDDTDLAPSGSSKTSGGFVRCVKNP